MRRAEAGRLAPGRAQRERLNKELRAAPASEEVKKRLRDDGATPAPDSPEDHAAAILADQKTWGAIVKKLGLRVQ